MQIEAPAAGGDCFAQGKHNPYSFFHGTREAAYWNYSSSPLAMTGISGIELTLRPFVIARLAGFPAEAISRCRSTHRRQLGIASLMGRTTKFLFPWDP